MRFGLSVGAALALVITASAQTAPPQGAVVWYTSMERHALEATVQRFEQTHPGIRVETLQENGPTVAARVLTEQRAGHDKADVVSIDELPFLQLQRAGALGTYRPRDAKAFIAGSLDGVSAPLHLTTIVIAYNPERLRTDHLPVPRTIDDFASPAWHGKFGVFGGGANWYFGVVQTRRDGDAVLARIAANAPFISASHAQVVQQLEAGEFDATPTAYGYFAAKEHERGRSVSTVLAAPILVSSTPIGFVKNPPHPVTARIFVDWLLSHEGQLVQAEYGYTSARSDVAADPAAWNPSLAHAFIRFPDGAALEAGVRRFQDLFAKAH